MSKTEPPQDDVTALKQELDQLRQRVAELEDEVEGGTDYPPGAADHRDARAIEPLEPGDVLSIEQVRKLYETRTDVKNDQTLRDRARDLLQRDAFESVDRQRWRYVADKGRGSA